MKTLPYRFLLIEIALRTLLRKSNESHARVFSMNPCLTTLGRFIP